jgi:HAD superfamily hydrolase (TIGR01549 family)
MMVRAIIFDLYGVLAINGWQAFKATHFADREDVWDQIVQIGRQVDAGLSDYTELVRFTAEVSGESQETVRYQLEHTVANTELLEFIRTELEGRYKLGVLSNASDDSVIGRLFTAVQQDIFDTVTLSHHVGMTKPDVHMYEVVASRLGVEPEDCVFVDDQERHVAGARAAAMQALLYKDLIGFKRDLAVLLADS